MAAAVEATIPMPLSQVQQAPIIMETPLSHFTNYLLTHVAHNYSLLFSMSTYTTLFRYIVDKITEEPGHVILEVFCFLLIFYLYFRPSYDPKERAGLSKREEEELLTTWDPEPLCPSSTSNPNTTIAGASVAPNSSILSSATYGNPKTNRSVTTVPSTHTIPVIDSIQGNIVNINKMDHLSFANTNFLGLSRHPAAQEAAKTVIENYGVGSCGPRGFYGTFDTHLLLEERLCSFFHVVPNSCILYSDNIATVSSIIPAFSKRGDIIIADESVSPSILQGIRLSRSQVYYYPHSDMAALEKLCAQTEDKQWKQSKKLSKLARKFIIFEGVSSVYGDCAPLPEILDIKKKYKFRVIMEDSFGVGVLGKTGRGTCEHFNVPVSEVDLFIGSLSNSIAGVGGFCIAEAEAISHQRLSGAGYCFSASSPPFTAAAAIASLEVIDKEPERLEALRSNATFLRSLLRRLPLLNLIDDRNNSPCLHLVLQSSTGSKKSDEELLNQIANALQMYSKIIISVTPPTANDAIPSSLVINVNALHSKNELSRLAHELQNLLTQM